MVGYTKGSPKVASTRMYWGWVMYILGFYLPSTCSRFPIAFGGNTDTLENRLKEFTKNCRWLPAVCNCHARSKLAICHICHARFIISSMDLFILSSSWRDAGICWLLFTVLGVWFFYGFSASSCARQVTWPINHTYLIILVRSLFVVASVYLHTSRQKDHVLAYHAWYLH